MTTMSNLLPCFLYIDVLNKKLSNSNFGRIWQQLYLYSTLWFEKLKFSYSYYFICFSNEPMSYLKRKKQTQQYHPITHTEDLMERRKSQLVRMWVGKAVITLAWSQRVCLGSRIFPYMEIKSPHSLCQALCLVWECLSSFQIWYGLLCSA